MVDEGTAVSGTARGEEGQELPVPDVEKFPPKEPSWEIAPGAAERCRAERNGLEQQQQQEGGGSAGTAPASRRDTGAAPGSPPGNGGCCSQTLAGAGRMECEGDPVPELREEPPEEPWEERGAARLARGAARALAVPLERWRRWAAGAAEPALRDFVRGAAGPALLAWRGPAGELGLRPGPPPPPPSAAKALFFLRQPGAGAGPAELLCGDLPAEPLPHFTALVEEVSQVKKIKRKTLELIYLVVHTEFLAMCLNGKLQK